MLSRMLIGVGTAFFGVAWLVTKPEASIIEHIDRLRMDEDALRVQQLKPVSQLTGRQALQELATISGPNTQVNHLSVCMSDQRRFNAPIDSRTFKHFLVAFTDCSDDPSGRCEDLKRRVSSDLKKSSNWESDYFRNGCGRNSFNS